MKKIKSVTKTIMVIVLILSVFATTAFAGTTWTGNNTTFTATSSDKEFAPTSWAKTTSDLYEMKFFESPQRNILKGEFMFVVLRTIQESLVRRGMPILNAGTTTLTFKDINTISTSAQEESKVLKSLGVLSGTPANEMALQGVVKRSEAAKVLAVFNEKVLKLSAIRFPKVFNDTKGHWAETTISTTYQIGLLNGGSATSFAPNNSLTLEQTLQILENLVGSYGIQRADVLKAMQTTFKVTGSVANTNSLVTQNSYVKYEAKMNHYGYNKVYANASAKTSESVTKKEALKMALMVTEYRLDAYDVLSKQLEPNGNMSDKATYLDVIRYFEESKTFTLKEYPVRTATVDLKDYASYSESDKLAIQDFIAYGIITPIADVLNANAQVFKGQLNEIAVNFAEKLSCISRTGAKIQLDPAKIPANAEKFLYISADVAPETYLMPLTYYGSNKLTPAEYLSDANLAGQVFNLKKVSEDFYNVILNVDYRTIDEKTFADAINKYLFINERDSIIKAYVDYVKKNKIVLSGKATFQEPIVYRSDMSLTTSRIKIEFEIVSSETNLSPMYIDWNEPVYTKYLKTNYDIMIDQIYITSSNNQLWFSPDRGILTQSIYPDKAGIEFVN